MVLFSLDQTNVAWQRNNTLWLSVAPDGCGVFEGDGPEEYAAETRLTEVLQSWLRSLLQ